MKQYLENHGFTITEILIVISIIGILATIVMVLYPGYQMRARDNERKSDVGQLAAAFNTYAIQKNSYIGAGSGCGANGNGNGWMNAGPTNIGTYPKSISTCLSEAGVITTATDFIDPSGCVFDGGGNCGSSGGPVKAYMKASCQKNGQSITYIFAHIESEPRKDAQIDALCDTGTVQGFTSVSQRWGTNYGMNYYTTVR